MGLLEETQARLKAELDKAEEESNKWAEELRCS